MQTTRRDVLASAQPAPAIVRYVRFQKGSTTAYGILQGDLLGDLKPSGAKHKLKDVVLRNKVVAG